MLAEALPIPLAHRPPWAGSVRNLLLSHFTSPVELPLGSTLPICSRSSIKSVRENFSMGKPNPRKTSKNVTLQPFEVGSPGCPENCPLSFPRKRESRKNLDPCFRSRWHERLLHSAEVFPKTNFYEHPPHPGELFNFCSREHTKFLRSKHVGVL